MEIERSGESAGAAPQNPDSMSVRVHDGSGEQGCCAGVFANAERITSEICLSLPEALLYQPQFSE